MGNKLSFKYSEGLSLYRLVIALAIFLTCVSSKKIDTSNYIENFKLPGTVKIDRNLYYDKTEVSVENWREYMYWTKLIFGDTSKEYLATLPDTLVWPDSSNLNTCYFVGQMPFLDFPIVGISQQQAVEYSKWRSDRVFELLLIELGVLKWDENQNRYNYFSIPKYYADTNTLTKLRYYPVYRLPNVAEWEKAVDYAGNITDNAFLCVEFGTKKYRVIKGDTEVLPPVYAVNYGLRMKRKNYIYNLIGNVREWTLRQDISVGGGWADSLNTIMQVDSFNSPAPNCLTGFRNICEWKEWKGK